MLDLQRIDCLGEALYDALVCYKTNPALIEANRKRESARYSFSELRVEAERIASFLQASGLKPGDRCAIVMSNQSRWVINGLAALWAGAVLVPLDYKLTAAEQGALIEHARPKALLTEYPVWRGLSGALGESAAECTVVVSEIPDKQTSEGVVRWEQIEAGDFTLQPRGRQDVACIVYSSGTGGRPKGCMLSHENYLEQAQSLGSLYGMEESDRYFSILPTNHAIDFMCGFLMPLLFGAAVVHQRTLRPEFLLPTMKRYGVTHMSLVPRILQALEDKLRDQLDELPNWQRAFLDGLVQVNGALTRRGPDHRVSRNLLKPIHDRFGGKLRLIFCGGAFVPRDTAEFFNDLGLPVVIGYGMTEAGTVITLNDLEPFRGDTVGKPVPGTTLEIRERNEEGIGEVWVQGPTVMKGYLDEPELTAETLVDGWLRTGDLGQVDAAGHLKLLGRSRNMIVTEGGKNIYPEDVETVFDGLSGCEEFCVFAANYIWKHKGMTGEQLALVVRPSGSEHSSAEQLRGLLDAVRGRNQKLTDFKRVSSIVLWGDEFPRTASQKIKRQVLAEQISSGRERGDALIQV